jgi:hypothetical protein
LLLIFVGSDEITAHLLSGHLSILFKNVIMEKFLVLMKMLREVPAEAHLGHVDVL